ncbi:hypothetical protein D9619_010594 [Psilocybe cf. subviscida]|uniref:Reverse transcriptase domain-containing protein n=1 Tax=Psilocybe cf. subviscida TaxID=2480587 RepID=A0A8H5ASP7_9AGAR|nr:hypothetical protein D9619_010594 [Psilocybe cf. subviscida]
MYAPWDVSLSEDDQNAFWPEVTNLCTSAPFSWSLLGDLNVTLSATETTASMRTAPTSAAARQAYSMFLQHTDAIDLWRLQPDVHTASSFTYSNKFCSPEGTETKHYSIIDRGAVSRTGIVSAGIEVLLDFVPCTDHRPIISQIVLAPPAQLQGEAVVPLEEEPASYAPRFLYPASAEKLRLANFRDHLHTSLQAERELFLGSSATVSTEVQFEELYAVLTDKIHVAATRSFKLPSKASSRPRKITSPTIDLLVREICTINKILGAVNRAPTSTAIYLPMDARSQRYLRAFLQVLHPQSLPTKDEFRDFFIPLRRNLHKIRFAEEKKERESQINRRGMAQIANVIHGGFSCLPLALTPSPTDNPDDLVTGSDGVKNHTVEYFQSLYHRTPRPPQEKPWMLTASVREVAQRTSQAPFMWPQLMTLADLKLILSKGNARPCPGPDGWEKWFLKHINNDDLQLVLLLINFILSNSEVPSCLKDTNISIIHKRNSPTSLANYRGIACSNIILNLVFAWLNHRLAPYLAEHRIIPDAQIATQPGTQGRDLVSFIAQFEKWASRTNTPLLMFQRDQKKGFDMLEPVGFYDALLALGLPMSIADLDRSSQEDVPYRVKTAYGFTDPFIVNGVTKQGGSLSPLKCTLTISLGTRWISDVLSASGNTLVMGPSMLHHPSTTCMPLPTVGAMDDSIMTTTSLDPLVTSARLADRFQATYGWETEWKKSALYVYNMPLPYDLSALQMPSVDYANPQSDVTSWHDVPILTDFTTFLRVPINRPDKQYLHIRDIIQDFNFPPLPRRRSPITLLRRIVTQVIISKVRPCLAVQPISKTHAQNLDRMLATKIHQLLGFPYQFSSKVLLAPIDYGGLGFPSIERLNAASAVSGVTRDLNHHLSPYRHMANITLADWSCMGHNCVSPLQHPDCTTFAPHQTRVPPAWSIAHGVLKDLALSLHPTDLSHLADGNVSIQHLYHQSRILLRHLTPFIPTRVFSNFARHGFNFLRDFGAFAQPFYASIPLTFIPYDFHFQNSQWVLTRDLSLILDFLQIIPLLFSKICNNDLTLYLPRETRKDCAEKIILSIAHNSPYPSISCPKNTLSSDASRSDHPSYGTRGSTTFSVSNHSPTTLAAKLPMPTPNSSLHGEVYGIIAACLLSKFSSSANPIIYSDHLNSVNLLSATFPPAHTIKTNPARSLYQWANNICLSSPFPPSFTHVKAHTNSTLLPARLNRHVDFVASHSHPHLNNLPLVSVPTPTFFMDEHMLYSHKYGFVESNITTFVSDRLAETAPVDYHPCHEPLPIRSLLDNSAPPTHPYQHSVSAFSTVIQLYARSGQLDTALSNSLRLGTDYQPWCRFGCVAIEDPHHLFVSCPAFASFRQQSLNQLLPDVSATLQNNSCLSDADKEKTLTFIQSLFVDSDAWPSAYSLYYLGLIPAFPSTLMSRRLHIRIAHSIHLASIQLAARIWGRVRCKSRELFHLSLSDVPSPVCTSSIPSKHVITLPTHLKSILQPNTYKNIHISFA